GWPGRAEGAASAHRGIAARAEARQRHRPVDSRLLAVGRRARRLRLGQRRLAGTAAGPAVGARLLAPGRRGLAVGAWLLGPGLRGRTGHPGTAAREPGDRPDSPTPRGRGQLLY